MTDHTFFFYDLETTSVNPRDGRIMQFAGQRTDMDLQPVGEPVNLMIKLTDDVVPEPDAIMVTGITPQHTLQDGLTEVEFLAFFTKSVATPNTIFVGYNTVRFDDEFMRFMLYRNFYDPYEWQWKDGRSRWDLLDVIRMTRALRPEGIKWPKTEDGKPTNRLELITALNGLDHEKAHDALNDVYATIAVAKLVKDHQPKLFAFLLDMRDKRTVAELVKSSQPFVYSSGKYANEYEKTTVAAYIADHPHKQGTLVFDLRHDPAPFLAMTPQQLVDAWQYVREPDPDAPRLPVKTLQFNRCPAVAPVGVLDDDSKKRLAIDLDQIARHRSVLHADQHFADRLYEALKLMDKARTEAAVPAEVDAQLYDGFLQDADKPTMQRIRAANAESLTTLQPHFRDARLTALFPLYKARNFPNSLSSEEREQWEAHRTERLLGGGKNSRLARYFARLEALAQTSDLTENQRYLLEELQLYGQSIMPLAE